MLFDSRMSHLYQTFTKNVSKSEYENLIQLQRTAFWAWHSTNNDY